MKNNKLISLLVLLLPSASLHAQNSKPVAIETDHTSLVFNIGKNGRFYQSYFGERLTSAPDNNILPQGKEAYITGGMEDQFQPAIRITHTDGNPSLELVYTESKVLTPDAGSTETIISLKDPQYPVKVNLHFRAYTHEDVIKTWTEITNGEKGTIVLNDYASSHVAF